jgi:hypothetical protein
MRTWPCGYILRLRVIFDNRGKSTNRCSKCALPEHQLIKIRRDFSEGMARWAYAVKIATCVYEGAPKSLLPPILQKSHGTKNVKSRCEVFTTGQTPVFALATLLSVQCFLSDEGASATDSYALSLTFGNVPPRSCLWLFCSGLMSHCKWSPRL